MSDKLTLYTIHEELQAWTDSMEMAKSEEERYEIAARVCQWLQAGRDKVDSFNAYMTHLEAQVELASTEIERIATIKRRIQTAQEQLEKYAISTMETLGCKKLEGHTSELSLRKRPASVVLDVEAQFLVNVSQGLEYLEGTITLDAKTLLALNLPANVNVIWRVKKAEIAAAIKAGKDVPGARLESAGHSLKRG